MNKLFALTFTCSTAKENTSFGVSVCPIYEQDGYGDHVEPSVDQNVRPCKGSQQCSGYFFTDDRPPSLSAVRILRVSQGVTLFTEQISELQDVAGMSLTEICGVVVTVRTQKEASPDMHIKDKILLLSSHYNNRPFPWRIVGPFPSDLSLGNARWGSFVRDSFPSDNPQRRGGSHSFFSQGTSATVAHFSPATCRWGICG
ncbi:hypothetical protein Tco_1544979 [Tanacetum coccineum]